jgi:hypothetical protein
LAFVIGGHPQVSHRVIYFVELSLECGGAQGFQAVKHEVVYQYCQDAGAFLV